MNRCVMLPLVCLLALSSSAGLCASWVWPPDEKTEDRVEANLSRHYGADDLRRYLSEADVEHRQALEFLVAWLPASDLGALPAELLIENVELAIETRDSAPWRDEIDPYLFHTCVLPHRVTQEPVQRWRPRLRELILPRIEGMNLEEAALEINRFCREWATYEPSSRRDQGPLTTMERGVGRCEEEMIFLICALRSVGIPARYCAAPYWTVNDSNHAWTEIYTGRECGWRYMGSCEPAACLDQAWFTVAARRAGIVLSAVYGEMPVPDDDRDRLHRQEEGTTILNSIHVYAEPGSLHLPAPKGAGPTADLSGDDPPEAFIHVFNFGGLAPLVKKDLGTDVLLGPGDYFVTTQIDSHAWSAPATVVSGERTQLHLEPGFSALENPIWLRYPQPSDEGAARCPIDEDDPVWLRHQRDVSRKDLERCRQSQPTDEWIGFLAERPEAADLHGQMESAGPLQAKWSSCILKLGPNTAPMAVDLVGQMDVKDFCEMVPDSLESILREALRVKGLPAVTAPDSLWTEYVLAPRLYFQPGTMDWWLKLPWLGEARDTPPDPTTLLEAFRLHVEKIEDTRLGHVATPAETWRSGYASTASGKACLVGLLRRHGIQARAERGVDYVEAWKSGRWNRFIPFEETEIRETEAPNGQPGKAYLAVSYFNQGRALENVETWRQTRLTRFEEGHFKSWYLGQLSEGDGLVEWSLPEGEYWLFGGLRNPRGEPRVVTRRIMIAAGDSLRLELDVGIPLAEWDAEDLVQKELDPEASIRVTRGGETCELSELAAGTRLFVLTLAGHESSTCHIRALLETDWEELGVSFVQIQVSGLAEHAADPASIALPAERAAEIFGVKNPEGHLPLTILVDATDKTLLWLRGARLDVAEHLKRILDRQ